MPQFHENDPFKDFKEGINNAADSTNEFDAEDIRNHKGVCSLAYIPILFWIPLVACTGSRFAKFHANQGLILFITMAALNIIGKIIYFVPFVSNIYAACISLIGLFYFIYGLVNTLNGNAKELPFIGQFHLIK